MAYDPQKHHRRSIRLDGYDYAQAGVYFVTLCSWRRECIFGEVVDDGFVPSTVGAVAIAEWEKSAGMRAEIDLDAWVLMPNHLHGLVVIEAIDKTESARKPATGATQHNAAKIEAANVGAHGRAPLQRKPRSLGSFVAGFKSAVTVRVNGLRQTPGLPVWHRNYYEHIVRNDKELNAIRSYIENNPLRWALDRDQPQFGVLDRVRDYWPELGANV